MRTVKRAASVVVLTAVMVAGSATTAFADQCYVVNRSEQGHKGAGHSAQWLSENSASHKSYDFVFTVFFQVDATDDMLDRAVQMHLDRGLQGWVSYFQGHTLMTNPHTLEQTPAAAKHSDDGRGIDHWIDTELGEGMIAIAKEILASTD